MQHDLEVWRDALNAFDHCEYEIAIVHFQKLGSLSKAWYNIGVSNIAIGSIDESIKGFGKAVMSDPMMAISYFQLAHLLFMSKRFSEAETEYENALKCMRGNLTMDYAQTGLDFCLYECELWYNLGLCQSAQGNTGGSLQSFMNAHLKKKLVRHDMVEDAFSTMTKELLPFAPPLLKVFRPKHMPYFSGAPLLNQVTGLHTPGPSNLESICGARKTVAVVEGELFQEPFEFGSNKPIVKWQSRQALIISSSTDVRILKLTDEISKPQRIRYTEALAGAGVSEVLSKIRDKTGHPSAKIKYEDGQGDWIGIYDDDDLKQALDTSGIIKLRLI